VLALEGDERRSTYRGDNVFSYEPFVKGIGLVSTRFSNVIEPCSEVALKGQRAFHAGPSRQIGSHQVANGRSNLQNV